MNEKEKAVFSAEESIGNVRASVSDLRERVSQNEGILFALLRELGYAPCLDVERTGEYHCPTRNVPSVKKL